MDLLEKQHANYRSAYNPITHDYDQTSRGKALETFDRLAKRRAEIRKRNIYAKGSSSYNLINGFDRRPVH
jgi:hypothetical protein